MKYGIWTVSSYETQAAAALRRAGWSAITAAVLCSRGYDTAQAAADFLTVDTPLSDPFDLIDMDKAARRVHRALERHEQICVFGDYDVDGITATCLLTDFLRKRGGRVTSYIPARLEEGYGLNEIAVQALRAQGVRLIITVDCGITASREAALCRELGMDLVITDHHECKERLPQAAALVDPHRADRTYPHTDLSGVGIAFKLAAALEGDQDEIARRYCDLFCLGTIADVMPLRGENRRLVAEGLRAMQSPQRLGLRALIRASECGDRPITAATVGFVLAPRINAAGRMEHAELAVQLFLTQNPCEAEVLAQTLCRLNRERQETEAEIYREAAERLRTEHRDDGAIVLAGENWHQGVIGIVASRLCEEFCRPTFLICLNGERGKASSRSYGGFDLFRSLTELAPLLEDFGGHEFAAGFTILRNNIDAFRREMSRRAEEFRLGGGAQTALELDGELPEALLTEENVEGLGQLEPCGTGCPKPIFCMSELEIERIMTVGNGGKHLRMRLRTLHGLSFWAIFFSAGSLTRRLAVGDRIDVACQVQINEFRDTRSVQLCLSDLRPASPTALFERFAENRPLSRSEYEALAPTRGDVATVWRFLCRCAPRGQWINDSLSAICRHITQHVPQHSMRRTLPAMEILAELGLIDIERKDERLSIRLIPNAGSNELENSRLYRRLQELSRTGA